VGLAERHVRKWIYRFRDRGIEGLSDAKRTGRPPVFSP
jgi:transposase